MENIIVASTNLVGLIAYPLCETKLERFALLMAMGSSILYHLMENQKHGMSGLSKTLSQPFYHQIFINFDRLSAILCVYVFLSTKILTNPNLLTISVISAIGIICGVLSEIVFRHPYYKNQYIITHCIWHICAFMSVYYIKK